MFEFSETPGLGGDVFARDNIKYALGIMEAHGFRLTEFNNNTYFLSGHPAIRLVGIQDDEKIMLYAIKSGANAYAVKYISSPDTYLTYLASAQQMLDSFQVINAQ